MRPFPWGEDGRCCGIEGECVRFSGEDARCCYIEAVVQATQVEVNATHERAGAEEESGAGNKAEN